MWFPVRFTVNCCLSLTVEELQHFMHLSKLQVSTKRKSETETVVGTVKPEDDGSVTISGVEIRPTSGGREVWNGH